MVVTARETMRHRLLQQWASLVDDLLSVIVAEVPAYSALDHRQLGEVRAMIDWIVARGLELWISGAGLTEDDLRRFRAVGAARARDGRLLTAVLRSYRVAASAFLNRAVDQFADLLDTRDVADLSRVFLALLDQFSEAIYSGYEATERSRAGDRDLALAGLLSDLLLGRQSHSGALTSRLRELDVRLPTSFDLLVMRPTRPDSAIAPDDLAAVRDRAGLHIGLHTLLDGFGVMVTDGPDREALTSAMQQQRLAGCLVSGVTALSAPRSYRLASNALRRVPSYGIRQRAMLDRGDAEVLALVAGHVDADVHAVVTAVLGELLTDSNEHLLAAVDAVLAVGGAAEAAQLLHLHAQTVRYRLRRVTAMTGRDLRNPWDRFVLQTARVATVGE